MVTAIPILIVLGAVAGGSWQWGSGDDAGNAAIGVGGLLFFAPLLMIVFRCRYPRWWFDWNLELQCFGTRTVAYLALMDDQYPSTDDHQSVHLDYPYPDAAIDLNRCRWLPLVKWFLAIPHYIVLFFLEIVAAVVAWFAILFTGRYPRGLFNYVEGVLRWHNGSWHMRSCSSPTSTLRSVSRRTKRAPGLRRSWPGCSLSVRIECRHTDRWHRRDLAGAVGDGPFPVDDHGQASRLGTYPSARRNYPVRLSGFLRGPVSQRLRVCLPAGSFPSLDRGHRRSASCLIDRPMLLRDDR